MSATTMAKELPLPFKAPMVTAIRDGRKSMTRRIVKGAWEFDGDESGCGWEPPSCPYKPGTRIWVKETWALVRPSFDPEAGIVDEVEEWRGPLPKSCPRGWVAWYAADSDDIRNHPDDRMVRRWRPSIFMPRWASRILLEVESVRVERLQAISEADAMAEGCTKVRDACYVFRGVGYDTVGLCHSSPEIAFACLWDEVNGPGSWQANPLVWVIGFRVLEGLA